MNREVLNAEWFDSNDVIPGLGSATALVPELLSRKSGEMGVWKRNPVLGHVIYRLSETKIPETRLFEDAKEDVYTAVRLEKAKAVAIETAKKVLTQVQAGTTLTKLVKKHGLKVETLEFTANTRFLPNIGDNTEFRKVGLHLNENSRFGLSLDGNRADLIQFNKRSLNEDKSFEEKDKVRAQLLQNLQQALLSKELKRLRDSASIEVINPVFGTPGSS